METKRWAVAVLLAGAPLLLGAWVSQQRATVSPDQCRIQEMDPRRGPARQTFCLGPDGEWRARPDIPVDQVAVVAADADALPDGWRGRINYSGVVEGHTQEPTRTPRRLTLGNALEALAGGERREFGGAYSLELTFEGDAVSGTFSGASPGRNRSGRVQGTRAGSQCRLFAEDILIEGECTAGRFLGSGRSQGGSRVTQTLRIDAPAAEVVDAAEQERQRAEAAVQAEQQRAAAQFEREQAAAAERARIAALPAANRGQTALVESAVRQDSGAWVINRYDAGSIGNVRIAGQSEGVTTLRAEYSYNGGDKGWVEARVEGGRVDCLRYWDSSSCNAPRAGDSGGSAGPAALTGSSGEPVRDTDGTTTCLRRSSLGGSNLEVRSREYGGDLLASREADRIWMYRNTCNRPVSYRMSFGPLTWLGGEEMRVFTLQPRTEQRWRCVATYGENMLGSVVRGPDHCKPD